LQIPDDWGVFNHYPSGDAFTFVGNLVAGSGIYLTSQQRASARKMLKLLYISGYPHQSIAFLLLTILQDHYHISIYTWLQTRYFEFQI
jgi:hypothetical protein